MHIWSPDIQKIPMPEAKAVFFFANQKALSAVSKEILFQAAAISMRDERDEKKRMQQCMGSYEYSCAIVDTTTITEEQISIRVIPMVQHAFVFFTAWMLDEFPNVRQQKIDLSNPATWFILEGADMIKFRFMFNYEK